MAVPTIPSGIALTHIQTEFGGSNPISINEYYSGGTYVPASTANATSVTIPTSGQIAFSNFSGASGAAAGPAALVKAFYLEQFEFGGFNATVSCRWGGLGSIANVWDPVAYNYTNVASYNWTTNPPTSTYDLRVTKTSGTKTLVGITNNTWRRMDTNITVSLIQTSIGFTQVQATCSIKYNSNSTIIDSNVGTWAAEWKP